MPKTITVRVDDLLHDQVMAYASANNLTKSQAVRELLRQVVLDADATTRGWWEGHTEAYADARKAIIESITKSE